jgi:hypothetical protein
MCGFFFLPLAIGKQSLSKFAVHIWLMLAIVMIRLPGYIIPTYNWLPVAENSVDHGCVMNPGSGFSHFLPKYLQIEQKGIPL